MKKIFLSSLICLSQLAAYAQVYSNKEVGKKNIDVIDSLKMAEYSYALPILGKKATQAGFSLPYSAGVNINYLWQESEVIIENLQIGFNHGPMHDVSEVIRFDNATATLHAVNIRPDIWVFPFLNVYGIFARSNPTTTVDFSLYLPDAEGNWNKATSLHSEANFEANTMGFGATPTIGVGNGWMALDMNFTWSDIDALAEPAFASVFGPRLGKSFRFKKPGSNIAIWVGAFRLHLNSGTSGSLQLDELFPTEGLQERINNGLSKVATGSAEVEAWWNGLTPPEQKNPINIAKYETVNRTLEAAATLLTGLDQSLNDDQHASVQYSLDKRPKDQWNFVVGTQYQHNKHWMLRAEAGFLGSRTQFIGGLQYRFGL